MKLSEMNGEQLMRTMCSLAPILCRMAEDTRAAEAIDRFAEAGGGVSSASVAALVAEIVPVLQENEEDFFRAAAMLTGKNADELRKMSGAELINELRKCWEEELLFFFSCAGIDRQGKS